MKVRISYPDRDRKIIATKEGDCVGETERAVFRLVQQTGTAIAMGVTVGEPLK